MISAEAMRWGLQDIPRAMLTLDLDMADMSQFYTPVTHTELWQVSVR